MQEKALMKEVLYANDLVLMNETMYSLKEKFLKWKSALEEQGTESKSGKDEGDGVWSDGKIIQNNLFIVYFYLYIYPPDSWESDGDSIHRVSNYPDLLPKMPRYCCPLLI